MKQGIICIETEWEITTKGNRRNIYSKPLMQFLSDMYQVNYIYRRVATLEELKYYLKKFANKEYSKYNIIYFSFHGQTHEICLESGESISLTELSQQAHGLLKDKFVHFSSCRTLLGSQDAINQFAKESGAKLVTGYTKSVDSDLSAIHDVALISQELSHTQLPAIIRNMEKLYSGIEGKLGFRHSQI